MAGKFWEDSDFMPEVYGATKRGAHRFAHILLMVIVGFFVIFYLWARQAELEEVTRGEGQVIPSGQVQVVQNLEGGIVAALNVHEGQLVDKGQVLLKIDNVVAASDLKESRARWLALSGLTARLEAETTGKDEINFPKDVTTDAPEIAKREQELFLSRKAGLDAELDILRRQEDQRRQ